MQEIWIPESIITLFLFVFIIRPFIKRFKPVEGLDWLPLLALLISLVLVPAYGFRPETIPLFVYTAVLTGVSLLRQIRGDSKFGNSRDLRFVFALPPLVLLAAAAGIAFFFTPEKDTALSTQGVFTLAEREYKIRVYTEESNYQRTSRRPLLVLLPPDSLAAIDKVSVELRDRGFTVLACERSGASPAKQFRRMNAFFSGTVSAKANARGRKLEEAGKEDLGFLLSWIRQNPQVEGKTRLFDIASADAVFLAGYGAGGSALILLDDSLSFGIKIRGLVAIESPLWSVYREETSQISDLPPDSGWFNSVRHGFGNWLWEIKPKKITGLGQVPELSTPILFLVSDRIRDSKYQNSRYLALLGVFRAARFPAVLASADGAGPLDYSDFPVRYPLISALFPGSTKVGRNNSEAPAETAAIITNFAAGIIETQGETFSLRRQSLPAVFQIESRNYALRQP